MSFFDKKKYKIPQNLIDELGREIFVSLNDDLMPDADSMPDENFVRVSFDKLGDGDEKFLNAVKEYIKVKALIEAEIRKLKDRNCSLIEYADLNVLAQMSAWGKSFARFVLTKAQKPDFKKKNTPEFVAYCMANRVHYVSETEGIFYDFTEGKRFRINCADVPGSADDAATYHYYYISEVE